MSTSSPQPRDRKDSVIWSFIWSLTTNSIFWHCEEQNVQIACSSLLSPYGIRRMLSVKVYLAGHASVEQEHFEILPQ